MAGEEGEGPDETPAAAEGAEEQDGAGEPKWAEWRYRKAERDKRELRQKLEVEAAQRAALEARLAAVEGRVAASEAPKEPAGPTLADLKKWKADYAALQQKVAADPENAEAKARLLEVKPEHVVAVDEAIMDMKAKEHAAKVKSDVDLNLAGRDRQNLLQRRLADEFGNDVLDLNSDLMKQAAVEYKSLLAEYGSDENGAVTRLAVERAYHAGNRAGRGADKDRRRLAVEEGARREASPLNSIAALMQKGDFRSQRKAVEIGLGAALKQWGFA